MCLFHGTQARKNWQEMPSHENFRLLTPLSSPLILSSNPIPTVLRITRQRKTQQNLNLSKQDEDHWARIGRYNSHPYHQGARHIVGRPLLLEEGVSGVQTA